MNRISGKEKEFWRNKLWEEQKGICPLCNTHISLCNDQGKSEAVLDHDHKTGHIRAVLHRSCNASEGKILTYADTRSRGNDPQLFITNLVRYWETDWSHNPIHSGHWLPQEVELKHLKAKVKRLKRQSAIDAANERIAVLKEEIANILQGH